MSWVCSTRYERFSVCPVNCPASHRGLSCVICVLLPASSHNIVNLPPTVLLLHHFTLSLTNPLIWHFWSCTLPQPQYHVHAAVSHGFKTCCLNPMVDVIYVTFPSLHFFSLFDFYLVVRALKCLPLSCALVITQLSHHSLRPGPDLTESEKSYVVRALFPWDLYQ